MRDVLKDYQESKKGTSYSRSLKANIYLYFLKKYGIDLLLKHMPRIMRIIK